MDIVKISRSLLVQYANYSIGVLSFFQTPKEMTINIFNLIHRIVSSEHYYESLRFPRRANFHNRIDTAQLVGWLSADGNILPTQKINQDLKQQPSITNTRLYKEKVVLFRPQNVVQRQKLIIVRPHFEKFFINCLKKVNIRVSRA